MFGIHAISAYLLVLGLLTLLAAVLIWQPHRSGKTVIVWLASAVVGILLGALLPLAAVYLGNFTVTKVVRASEAPTAGAGAMPGMGGGGMPGMGGGMGMFGGPREPRPKRDLTTLVRKIELLTGDVAITLSDDQGASLCSSLADIEQAETMSDDDAKAKHDEILALLDEDQKARLDAISLSRMRPGGPGGPGAGGPGPSGPGAGGPGPGGPGGPGQADDANPFQQEDNAQAVAGLRKRFAPSSDQPGEESGEEGPPPTQE